MQERDLDQIHLRFSKDIFEINLELTQITTTKVKLRADPLYLLGKSSKFKTNYAIVFRRPQLDWRSPYPYFLGRLNALNWIMVTPKKSEIIIFWNLRFWRFWLVRVVGKALKSKNKLLIFPNRTPYGSVATVNPPPSYKFLLNSMSMLILVVRNVGMSSNLTGHFICTQNPILIFSEILPYLG